MISLEGIIKPKADLIISVGKKKTYECKKEKKSDIYKCEDITERIKKLTTKSIRKLKPKKEKKPKKDRFVKPPRHKNQPVQQEFRPPVQEFQTPVQSQVSMTNAQLQRLINRVDRQEELAQNIIQGGRQAFSRLSQRVEQYNRGHDKPPSGQDNLTQGSIPLTETPYDLDEDAEAQTATIETQTDEVEESDPIQTLHPPSINISTIDEALQVEELTDDEDEQTIIADPPPPDEVIVLRPQQKQLIKKQEIQKMVDTKLQTGEDFTAEELREMLKPYTQLGKKRSRELVEKGFNQFRIYM
jgi:hypothetical protein